MRILYHHRTLADGAEGVHIASMVAAFRNLGHEVHVSGLAGSETGQERRGFVEVLKGVLPGALFEVASFASNIPDYLDVRHRIRQFRPDVMYKRHGRNDVGALYAAHAAGVPAVLEVNALFTGRRYQEFEPLWLGRFTSAFERRALRLAHTVLAVSTPLAREISSLGEVEAFVCPNGADPERFDASRAAPGGVRTRYGLGESLVVGWAGVIREWHGLELLLDELAGLPDVRLLIVGDGPAKAAMEDRGRARGVLSRLVFTGRVPHDEMRDHIAAMDIAVVAADRTGVASPMKLLEYMAMSRAVVAPDLENIRDVVTDHHDGFLFRDGDSADLSRVLRTMLSDALLRLRLGQAARATILERRNWRRNAEHVLSLVDCHDRSKTGRKGTVLL